MRRQRAVHEQVRDFLERRLRGEVVDVVAAVMQVVAAAADGAQRGVARGGAAQRDGFLGLRQDLGSGRSSDLLGSGRVHACLFRVRSEARRFLL
jgi:hypothetical protein